MINYSQRTSILQAVQLDLSAMSVLNRIFVLQILTVRHNGRSDTAFYQLPLLIQNTQYKNC